MPRLLLRVEGASGRPVPLGGDEVRIGRSQECEVVIDDSGASRVHAVVREDDEGWVVEDAGSRNGTRVNGRPVERHHLRHGDVIGIGERTTLTFEGAGPSATETRPGRAPVTARGRGKGRPRAERSPGGWLRTVTYRLDPLGDAGAPERLTRRVTTVGREGAGVAIGDGSVSRLHARLDREGGTLWVTDLKSRNGTHVNGEAAMRAELRDGDVVRFGDVEFEVAREVSFAWQRLVWGGGAVVVAVALGLGVWMMADRMAERSVRADAERRVHRQALASLSKGIAAFRRGDVDFARGYFLYAADVLLLSSLVPPGASLSRPQELFGRIARELPPQDRDFDFARVFDLAAAARARAQLEGLSDRDYVGRQIRRIAIELGQDESIPSGFVDQVWGFVRTYSSQPGFQRLLDRSVRVQGRLQTMLREAHLPEAFCYVAWAESALDPTATSGVGARGLWQFMPATARMYGLRVDGSMDERTDVVRSTQAATRYIGNLIRKFGREQFMCALASYNRGEGGVWRAMEKIPDPMMESSRKYWYLVENGLLPKETSDYVPKIFAHQIIAEDPVRFGFRRP